VLDQWGILYDQPIVLNRRQAGAAIEGALRLEALHAYIAAAGIAEDRKGWLFRTSPRHNATVLTEQPMNQADAWRMIRRRAAAPGIIAPIAITRFARPASA
jgi:hypothetical protein